ncbi:MAG: hypothetical protein QW275_00090 [Candidatus Anstonellaceae archaeon]
MRAGILTLWLICLLLSNAASAGFSERIQVQVFDQNLRPIEGAQVYVEHQLNSVQGYVKTKPISTNQSGLAELVFTNYEQIAKEVDYSYKLYIKYGSQLSVHNLIARGDAAKARVISDTSMKSYFLNVKVINQRGAALPAKISVADRIKNADAAGSAIFQLPPGNFTIKAEAGGAVRTKNITLVQDAAEDIIISLYSIEVTVTDDSGKPLIAYVETEGKKFYTGIDGKATFYNISNQFPQVVAKYNETVKRFSMDLERQPNLRVVFDLSKPIVKETHVSISKNGAATLSIFVEDPGRESSGISSLSVSYEIDGVENKVPVYGTGYNTYEAKIPSQAPRTLVKYFIKVSDGEGNTAYDSGTYFIPSLEEPKQNTTSSNPQIRPKQQESGMEPIVVGLLVFFIFTFGAFYYIKNRAKAGQSPPKPISPPPAPPV